MDSGGEAGGYQALRPAEKTIAGGGLDVHHKTVVILESRPGRQFAEVVAKHRIGASA
jgi:hypothetical protein